MTEIRFYHLRTTALERALPQLLEKILARGTRAVVMAGSPERVAALDDALWTYDDRSFLPHGSARDGFAEEQPVWLTMQPENPNRAEVLVLTDGAVAEVGGWPMVLEIFDGNSDDAVAIARERWKAHKAAGHELTYWKQDDQGKWEKSG
ncbi:MAG TPA: DNA polymerase III subunit chi [Alphaproteobacteria bacterium]|nr:DNA polymerase III subunit chi [Alphaproteobacteria bacterium]